MRPEEFQRETGVSRETIERLTVYLETLVKWNERINLVGRGSLVDPWRRHMLDSAQLLEYLPQSESGIADFGTGAGFPGLVLALMGAKNVVLLDSDSRKCVFLQEVARLTGARIEIRNARLEALAPWPLAAVTARAVAPLERLIPLIQGFIELGAVALLPKGREWQQELTRIRAQWEIRAEVFPSKSDGGGRVLRISEVLSVRQPNRSPARRGQAARRERNSG
jgi:16S rRNA (guanine527-N7)-methyltransferase